MVGKITGGIMLPTEVLEQIVEKTDGVPLFVEELTKTILESGLLTRHLGHYQLSGPLPEVAVPATLHDSLMARLDRLGPVKEVAQTAAAIGREFSYDLLAAVSPLSFAELHDALDQLIDAELVFRHGPRARRRLHIQACTSAGRRVSVATEKRAHATTWAHRRVARATLS